MAFVRSITILCAPCLVFDQYTTQNLLSPTPKSNTASLPDVSQSHDKQHLPSRGKHYTLSCEKIIRKYTVGVSKGNLITFQAIQCFHFLPPRPRPRIPPRLTFTVVLGPIPPPPPPAPARALLELPLIGRWPPLRRTLSALSDDVVGFCWTFSWATPWTSP